MRLERAETRYRTSGETKITRAASKPALRLQAQLHAASQRNRLAASSTGTEAPIDFIRTRTTLT